MTATSGDRRRSSPILSICKVWDADYPWDIRVEKVSTSLVDAGHIVHLVCRNAARRPRHEAHGRFVIHRLPITPPALRSFHGLWNFPHPASPVWAHAIWRVARDTHADVILVRDLPLALPAALIGRALSIPVVLDMAEHYAGMLEDLLRYTPISFLGRLARRPRLARVVERLALRLVDRVIVVVEESRDRLLADGMKPERLTIVSNTPRLDQWEVTEAPGSASSRGEVDGFSHLSRKAGREPRCRCRHPSSPSSRRARLAGRFPGYRRRSQPWTSAEARPRPGRRGPSTYRWRATTFARAALYG